ncbi:MBL fold metallo-hydrolase [Dechloromonas denitrificans]|uniref:MBL fold metallo-hydrolase n=1 Tax=Dechloromonas denitrificans TaxID=281362 RepID=UPI001CF9913F|nr:MBL fold metallo-hydrolase [Dechloromonas denitrificans]UCV06458.1 MBL fold metallo-hydrolase [Dechloromonas denitrificans]
MRNLPRNTPRLARLFVAGLFLFCTGLASAEAPQTKTQVPGYYRMFLGNFEITALYDGAIKLDTKLLKNTNDKEVQKLLARLFVKGPAVQTAVNAYLINTGSQLVLVDAGAAKAFGPALGNIVDNLKAAGYRPEQVDTVLVTHLHGDHVNGMVDAQGKAVFSNAEIWSAKADNDFWLNAEIAAKAPQDAQPFFKMARDAAAPYLQAGKWKTYAADQEILPGISSFAANGHTPGHSAYLVGSGEEKLLIWGDIVHNHAVQFARPQVAIEFDVDRKAAVATRQKIFAKAASEKILIGGMHLPFPGIGHVRKEAKGYSWVPAEFAPTGE